MCAHQLTPHTHEEPTTKTHNFKFPPRQLRLLALPRIPLIEDLTSEPLPPGLNLLVEFDPVSQWYNACYTIAVGWLKQGGGVSYTNYAQPSENVRTQLRKLGLNVDELEKNDYATLRIWDSYSATLGQISRERLHVESLKVHDQSISTLRDPTTGMAGPRNHHGCE